jgi:hypothetical protein
VDFTTNTPEFKVLGTHRWLPLPWRSVSFVPHGPL